MSNDPNVSLSNGAVPDAKVSDGDEKVSSSLELLALVTASFGSPEQHISAALPAEGSAPGSIPQSIAEQQSGEIASPGELLALVTASFSSDSW